MLRRRQQEQESLLYQAICHGSYLWSNRDVENALLWFQPPTADEQLHDEGGCEFLRRLLHAPGGSICRPRPNKLQGTKKRKKSSLIGGAKSHDHENRSNKNRLKKDDEPHKSDGASVEAAQAPPLRSVVLGYYQLFLASSNDNAGTSQSLQTKNDEKREEEEGKAVESGFNNCHFSDTDIQQAELASSRLLADLNSIITARKETNDIYQAFTNVVSRENVTFDSKVATTSARSRERMNMSRTIDEYMTRPTTCTRGVYASSIFDRLLSHCQRREDEHYTAPKRLESDENGDNSELHRFLNNLFRLASTNVKVQEVLLLVLLEPVRRLGCSRNQQCRSLIPPCSKPKQMTKELNSQNQRSLPGSTEFPPIPACTSLWSKFSTETIANACTSCSFLPMILQTILSTSPRSTTLAFRGDSSLGDGTSSLLVAPEESARDATDCSDAIVWWTLPSPLLCIISHLYLPIACKYIQYWIGMSLISHEKLYSSTGVLPKGTNCRNENLDNIDDSFVHALRRIKQFRSTSDRLSFLCTQSLKSMETQSSSLRQSSISDEDENSAFKLSFAWKAIHRALEK